MMTIKAAMVGLLAALLISPAAFAGASHDFGSVEEKIHQALQKRQIPSMVVAVVKDGRIVYERAFGAADIEGNAPATVHTAYRLASVSKPMTATGLMILYQKGLVDLDAPAARYMAPLAFRSYSGNVENVTLRHLLSHTSGLSSYYQYGFGEQGALAADFATAFNRYGFLFHPPGTLMEYSNLGYGLIDFIIARRSGKPFGDFMRREVFEPLGMKDSFVDGPHDAAIKVARGYDKDLQRLPELHNNTAGGGNIYSSIHDLMLFSTLHLRPGNASKPLLTPANVELMRSDTAAKGAFSPYFKSAFYGLGWYVRRDDSGYESMWHEGGMPGVSSMVKLLPHEGIAAAAVTNIADRGALVDSLVNELINVVLPSYRPEPLNVTANYKQYAGEQEYLGQWTGSVRVRDIEIPCTLTFEPDGGVRFSYREGQSAPQSKQAQFRGIINGNSFIASFAGTLPADDVQNEPTPYLILHLIREGDVLSGRIGAYNGAAASVQHLYPFYVRLQRDAPATK